MSKKTFFTVALIMILLIVLSLQVYAQDVPTFPAYCYGELKINDQPAPLGTLVVAKVDNVERGRLETFYVGWHGRPGLESKLLVSGSVLAGQKVKFYVSGQGFSDKLAGEAPYWGSGNGLRIDLTVVGVTPDPTDPGDPTAPGPSDPSQPADPTEPGGPTAPGPSDPSQPAPAPSDETGVRLGDITGSGDIDIRDVTLALQHVLGIKGLTEEQKKAADVNGDGVIDVLDVALLMKYVLSIIDSF